MRLNGEFELKSYIGCSSTENSVSFPLIFIGYGAISVLKTPLLFASFQSVCDRNANSSTFPRGILCFTAKFSAVIPIGVLQYESVNWAYHYKIESFNYLDKTFQNIEILPKGCLQMYLELQEQSQT